MTISILLPSYNHGRFIGRALRALASQTVPPDEIIVIDDCSTDDTIAVVERFAEELPRLRMLRNPENLGVNRSVNLGIAQARGDYVVCSAADDWLEPVFVEQMTAACRAFPEARLFVSAYVELQEAQDRLVRHGPQSELGCWYAGDETSFISADALRSLFRRGFVWLPINGALIHRATIAELGGLDPDLRWHADWFATMTIALRHGFAVVPKPMSVFRVAADTHSGSGMREPRLQRAVCAAIFAKLKTPAFQDVYRAVHSRPGVLSPFFRYFLMNLMPSPGDWRFLGALLTWWLNEVRKGRRPRQVREFLKARDWLAPPY